jgi:hypothetical protein
MIDVAGFRRNTSVWLGEHYAPNAWAGIAEADDRDPGVIRCLHPRWSFECGPDSLRNGQVKRRVDVPEFCGPISPPSDVGVIVRATDVATGLDATGNYSTPVSA